MPKNFTRFIFTHQRKVRLSRCFYIFQCDCWHDVSAICYDILLCLTHSDVILSASMILFNIQGFQFKAIYTLNWLWICLTCNLLNLDLFDSYVIEFQLNQSSKSIISSSIKLAQGFQINPQICSYITKLRNFLILWCSFLLIRCHHRLISW